VPFVSSTEAAIFDTLACRTEARNDNGGKAEKNAAMATKGE
jgi:hypothetical protein